MKMTLEQGLPELGLELSEEIKEGRVSVSDLIYTLRTEYEIEL